MQLWNWQLIYPISLVLLAEQGQGQGQGQEQGLLQLGLLLWRVHEFLRLQGGEAAAPSLKQKREQQRWQQNLQRFQASLAQQRQPFQLQCSRQTHSRQAQSRQANLVLP